MRIGILTFNHSRNYGAMLQAYALQSYLRDHNIDALHIRIKGSKVQNKSIKDVIRKVIKHQSYRAYQEFSNRILYYPGEYDETNSDQLNDSFDVFMSGSDQVWNVTNGMNPMFFQSFVRKRIKASYAASIGIEKIPDKLISPVRNELETFDFISVREKTAKMILDGILSKSVSRVVDPVFLLSKVQWDLICGPRIEKSKYVFVYGTQMTEHLTGIATSIAQKYNLNICSVYPMKGAKSLDSRIGPAEFVNYVKNAEYVVTTSFHCTAFSLIYERPLIEILHSTTGSRAADLLDMVGMKEYCVWKETSDISKMYWDYTEARSLLSTAIKESQEYLQKIINENNRRNI